MSEAPREILLKGSRPMSAPKRIYADFTDGLNQFFLDGMTEDHIQYIREDLYAALKTALKQSYLDQGCTPEEAAEMVGSSEE